VQSWIGWIVIGACASACGDNDIPIAPPLAHSDTLFLAAHEDDDMIFMQPELVGRLARGESTTTVYASTAGPDGRGRFVFYSAMVAYGKLAGSDAWDCGQLPLGTIVVEHCRLRDRPVSILDFGIADGAINGDRPASLLHLIDGSVPELPADSGGTVTRETVVDLFGHLLDTTTPNSIETLELAGSHGRDNSSHMFVASIGLWAAARAGFSGPITWHRGYNVEVEQPTLDGDDLTHARTMLGYYEACADRCAACGTSCPSVNAAHETWLSRQYATGRVLEAHGKLALGERCLDASLALDDCANAIEIELAADGVLRVGDSCVTSAESGSVSVAPCTGAPEQYWVLDTEGALWNGRPPQPGPDMAYDHVRCLTEQGVVTCGANLQAHWTFLP
jgi:hypothetical protein